MYILRYMGSNFIVPLKQSLGSAMVNHNDIFYIYLLNQKIILCHKTKRLIFHKGLKYISGAQDFMIHVQNRKCSSPVANSVYGSFFSKPRQKNMLAVLTPVIMRH